MQQWKLYNIAEKIKTLLTKGKTLEDFKNINDKTMSTKEFTDLLFYTLHPFEIKDYVKILSPIQKAITMVIYLHGGYASEDDIINFLNRHWQEITAVSKKSFVRKPDSRLLHMNMSQKKKGLFTFVNKPDDPKMICVNDADATENTDNSDDSNQEESRPMRSRERSRKSADTDNFNPDGNNSDNSYFDMDASKEDNDDNDDLPKTRRGGRYRGKSKGESSPPLTDNSIRDTRSKKDRRPGYGYNLDEKDKQNQTNSSNYNNNDYNTINNKSNDYHYGFGRGARRFNSEPIHQNSQSSQAPVKSIGSSISMMKMNSTLILPPTQKDPPPFFSLLPSDSAIDEKKKEEIDIGTGLTSQWRWCNFSMSTAERVLFFPLSKPLESSVESVQGDPKFDFDIPDELNFDKMVIFVVEEACSRASTDPSTNSNIYGVTIDQVIEKIEKFKDKQGSFLYLPVENRVRAVLLEAKNAKIVDSILYNEKELWYSNKSKESKDDISKIHNMFKISLPKPFATLKIKDMTVTQMYEKFTQDKSFGLECTEFLP